VRVLIDTEAGTERHMIRLDTAEQRFTLRPAGRAAALRIDPEHRLFRRLPREEVAPIIRGLVVAPDAVTVAAGTDPAVQEVTRRIAQNMLEAGVHALPLDQALAGKRPLLLVGTTAEVDVALARAGLPARPAQLTRSGTAWVWTGRRGEVPFLVVEAASAAALSSIATVIRHYGASSYVVFEGRTAVDRGVWPPSARPLEVTLAN
jgi:hypothetical protein